MQILSKQQVRELEGVRKTHPKPYVRVRAMALLNLNAGKSVNETAEFIGVFRHALVRWRKKYAKSGIAGLEVERGRGRRSKVNEDEVLRIVSQSPRNFGLKQERWTLESLRDTAPSLRHLKSLRGVEYVLERLALSPKRSQYRRASPDPDYEKKSTGREMSRRSASKPPGSSCAL